MADAPDFAVFSVPLADLRKVFVLACRLQDSDQCESHSTGDDCETGEIEHDLFQELSRVRIAAGDAPKLDTARGPATPEPSTLAHVPSSVDGCVSWCPACAENVGRGFSPDGSRKL